MLVTLAEAKTYLDITDTSKDQLLTGNIAIITKAIEHYCKRIFTAQNYTFVYNHIERYPRLFWDRISVKAFPVIESTEVRIDGKVVPSSYYDIFATQGFYYFNDDVYDLIPLSKDNVKLEIDFRGGLDPIPEDLKFICYGYLWQVVDSEDNSGSYTPSDPNLKNLNLHGKIRIEKFGYDRTQELILSSKNRLVLDAYHSGDYLDTGMSELRVRA